MKNLKSLAVAALLVSAFGSGAAYAQASQSAVKVTVLAQAGAPSGAVPSPNLAPPPGPPRTPPNRPPRVPPTRS